MVTTKLNLSMTEPQVRQIYAKQGDTGRVLDITLDQTPEDGTLRILRPDGTEVTSEAVTGGEVSESGETVTFDSLTEADVTELTVGIEPVQDLNGYDAPWVGGAGKNLYNASAIGNLSGNGITATISNGTITLNGTATANAFFSIHNTGYANQQYTFSFNNPVANSGVHISFRDTNGNYFNDVPANVVNKTTTFTNEPSSILLYVTSGTTLSNFVVKPQLELGYTATAWQPYSNICPITGHDEVEVTQTGKNFLENLGSSVTTKGITYTVNSDGSFTVKGTATARANLFLRTVSNPQHLPPGNYILSQGNVFGAGEAFLELAIRRANGTTRYANLNDRGNFAFALNEGDIYQPYFSVYSGTTIDATIYPMVRLASEADSTFEPYRSNTYTTSLGQTVYGGTLDLVSGVLTVDKAMVDLGSLNWGRYNEIQTAYVYLASLVSQGMDTSSAKLLSSVFKCRDSWTSLTNLANGEMQSHPSLAYAYARCDSYTTASDFKTAVTGQQLVFELATPQTYTLTPQQIKTLVGTNNVWASSGDIVSTKFAYDGLLSELPSEATEIVGKCYCDVEQNGVSSMPFTLNVKKNERAT